MTIDVSLYLNRVPPLHRDKPLFMATLAMALQPFVDANNFLASIPTAFDIDNAIGAQLDILGLWLNQSRTLGIPLQNVFFSWGDPLRGWGRGIWFNPDINPGVTYTQLDDDVYRSLLKAIAIANEWDGTVEMGQTVLDEFFPPGAGTFTFIEEDGFAVQGGENIQKGLTIGISGVIPSIVDLQVLAQDLLRLKPGAMNVKYRVTSVNGAPIFGFGVDNEYIGGWGRGAWGVSPETIAASDPALLKA